MSARGFHALIAIAEKAGVDSRQGSVRWGHIRAGLYGASQRTAERAVQDLKNSGLIRVIRPGFNNNHGRAAAPIYEIQRLPTAESGPSDTDTQVTESVPSDTDTQVTESVPSDTDRTGGRYRQIGDRYRHPGGVLDGSIDGSTDGQSRTNTPHAPADRQRQPDWVSGPYGPRCVNPKHIDDPYPPACRGCEQARLAHVAEDEASRTAVSHAVADCSECDDYGRLDDLSDCPRHTNFRQLDAELRKSRRAS